MQINLEKTIPRIGPVGSCDLKNTDSFAELLSMVFKEVSLQAEDWDCSNLPGQRAGEVAKDTQAPVEEINSETPGEDAIPEKAEKDCSPWGDDQMFLQSQISGFVYQRWASNLDNPSVLDVSEPGLKKSETLIPFHSRQAESEQSGDQGDGASPLEKGSNLKADCPVQGKKVSQNLIDFQTESPLPKREAVSSIQRIPDLPVSRPGWSTENLEGTQLEPLSLVPPGQDVEKDEGYQGSGEANDLSVSGRKVFSRSEKGPEQSKVVEELAGQKFSVSDPGSKPGLASENNEHRTPELSRQSTGGRDALQGNLLEPGTEQVAQSHKTHETAIKEEQAISILGLVRQTNHGHGQDNSVSPNIQQETKLSSAGELALDVELFQGQKTASAPTILDPMNSVAPEANQPYQSQAGIETKPGFNSQGLSDSKLDEPLSISPVQPQTAAYTYEQVEAEAEPGEAELISSRPEAGLKPEAYEQQIPSTVGNSVYARIALTELDQIPSYVYRNLETSAGQRTIIFSLDPPELGGVTVMVREHMDTGLEARVVLSREIPQQQVDALMARFDELSKPEVRISIQMAAPEVGTRFKPANNLQTEKRERDRQHNRYSRAKAEKTPPARYG